MASTAPALTEPRVLAHTKRRLFPDDRTESYVVVDTQFASEQWLAGDRIDAEIKELLSPFNHVQVGSGYPDLVGVQALDDEFLAVDELGTDPPLIAVEAKGYTDAGQVDTQRGIVQAYDRLHEANAAYVAAPASAIAHTEQAMARELNVGVLGVRQDGTVDPIETPRVVGHRATTETHAIRFQASAQGVADASFGLNHPKNYLAYPLTVCHPGPTEEVLTEHVVGAIADARRGAVFLDLIDDRAAQPRVTPLGREVVRFALQEYGSVEAALEVFDDWRRSQQRFCEIAPRWGLLARRVVYAYPATQLLVGTLQDMHEAGIDEPTLPEVVDALHTDHPSFAIELFVRGEDAVRTRVLDSDGTLQRDPLADGAVYHSPTVFQLKAMLFHAGIVTERGSEPSNLDPTEDVWALRHPVFVDGSTPS